MKLKHPKSIKDVEVFESAASRKTIYGVIVLLLYAWVFQELYTTMGMPREEAIVQLNERKINEVQELAEQEDDGDGFVSAVWDDEDDTGPVDPLKKAALADPEKASAAGGSVDDWYDEDETPLPSVYLPSALSCAAFFVLCSCHALFYLLCHWSTAFKSKALFSPVSVVTPGSWVHVVPHQHRGKAALCLVTQSQRTGHLGFVFQNQKYEYVPPADISALQGDSAVFGGEDGSGAIRLIRCPVDNPIVEYTRSKGLQNEDEAASRLEHFGKNKLAITTPKFHEILMQQLIAPIAVFQIFCSLLWMLDMYWQYTVFTVMSIVMLESTSAFQRMKTLTQLNGMTSKPYQINVYRMGKWAVLTTEDLMPGDLISLKRKEPLVKAVTPVNSAGTAATNAAPPKPATPISTASSDIVPCDCVLLNGSAVVNEATLTGESVPQMKDALKCDTKEDEARPLDIDGRDRLSVLFSGTTLVNVGSPDAESPKALPKTPDGGALCYVLRTGFSSSQGELVQLIEFSQQSVSADSWEVGAALFLLLLFALAAAGYVMKTGLEKGDRTTHELMLKCVIIITSVVPRQLPVQMAMAVNTALMALTKEGVYCTEPYRVPWVGKISHCLFDKTGTITTDTLVPAGVVNAEASNPLPVKAKDASGQVAMVLGGCNALMEVEGVGLIGDPIELAALRGVDWRYEHTSETARPGNWEAKEKKIAALTAEKSKMPANSVQLAEIESKIKELQAVVDDDKIRAERCDVRSVKIKERFHFASQLQRMSVIAHVENKAGDVSPYCLVKGSPEAIAKLLAPGATPAYYDAKCRELTEQGLRVLALAYRRIASAEQVPTPASREWVESDLQFAGFVAFECKMRSDSPTVMMALVNSDHKVAMLTGDAPLTALHVAKTVGICSKNKLAFELRCTKDGAVEWVCATGTDPMTKIFSVDEIPVIAHQHDLMTTEAALLAAAEKDKNVWREVDHIKVFARCSPQGKANVIRSMQKYKQHQVLMCGDGGNDVGALKQAEVGLALLSGYGNNMVGADAEHAEKTNKDSDEAADDNIDHEAQLNQQSEELQNKAKEAAKVRKAMMAAKQKELTSMQQKWVEEYLEQVRIRSRFSVCDLCCRHDAPIMSRMLPP
eukprot:SAG31_NODE_40_length_31360_cov_6.751575_7_plen_1122_part_00